MVIVPGRTVLQQDQQWHRFATRRDKPAANYFAVVELASVRPPMRHAC
jgi:hypothetical protein